MHIIVDGYNLIRQSSTLRRFERISLERGRGELIRRVAGYRRLRGHTMTVVFDGWMAGPAQEERLREEGVHIVYSGRGETADEVIKRMARAERGSEVIVVSSDREVANAAVQAGGVAISSPEFEERMEGGDVMRRTSGDEDTGEDDDIPPGFRTRKKGTARRMSKRHRQAQRRLSKL